MKNSGYIYKDDKLYYIAYHRDQREEFEKLNKTCVHVFEDRFMQKPVLNERQQPKKILKDVKLLTFIGFND